MSETSVIRGVILSGGTGSRFRPFTYSIAKQLLPLANRPVVGYAVDALVQAGVTDIAVVVGSNGDQIESALGSGERFGARLTYIKQEAPLGLAHAVQTAERFTGSHPFVVFLGDNFLPGGIVHYVEQFRASGADALILLSPVSNPGEFGIAVLDERGRPVRLVEKPSQPESNLAVIGVYMLNQRFFEAARCIAPSARGELEITDALQRLIESGADVRATVLERGWMDIGRPQDLLAANHAILEEMVRPKGCDEAAGGLQIVRSRIEGHVAIGTGVTLSDCRIGPGTSVGNGCALQGVDIEDSILLENVVVDGEGLRIRGSIIGRGARLTGSNSLFQGLLGDDCRVHLT